MRARWRRALLVVDVQEGLVAKKLYEKARFLATIMEAIDFFRKADDLIVFIRHDGAVVRRGKPEWELYSGLGRRTGDPIVDKKRGDAFDRTDLARILEEAAIEDVLVCGLVTHGCVRATCLGGRGRGFAVRLLGRGHSNWAADAAARIESTERELAAAGIPTVALDRMPEE
jgi:nicotinamidase-related amidase